MQWVPLAAIAVAGLSAWLTYRSVRLGQGHVEQLRAMDWKHGRVSRQREAYVAGLCEALSALEHGRAQRRAEFAAAAARIELYGSDEAVASWRSFAAALDGGDREQARAVFEDFTRAARRDDQATL